MGDQTVSDDLITDLESTENIQSVAVKSQLREEMDSLYETTKTTVYIMIILSACLALAVIFNISSINIFERKRDMATLKVLGYHKGEIRSLVNTENFFITTFGCFIGVIFGAILFKFVLASAESEEMYIPYNVSFSMILLSIVLTYLFTILANLMLQRKINKIDMVESLKSVE
ncbi:ABC transporter permease [Cytobacillus purgationiresistens]|nr:FtsX-like permease family protein [Cytobacillus purgationiresistens]